MNSINPKDRVASPQGQIIYRRRKEKVAVQEAEEPIYPLPKQVEEIAIRAIQAVEVKGTSDNTLQVIYGGKRPLPKLPEGYFFKGSAPRELLRETFFPRQKKLKVRDLDVVRFVETIDKEDHHLSLKYMSEDYQFGRGVEVVEDKTIYFQSRDFSVNEVLFCDRTLECTYQAMYDLRDGVIRATEHVTDAEGHVQSRVTAKALRLVAEAAVGNSMLKLEAFKFPLSSEPFDLALHLDRALSFSACVAEEYLLLAWEHRLLLPQRQVPPTIADAVWALSKHMHQGIAFFRNLPNTVVVELALRG